MSYTRAEEQTFLGYWQSQVLAADAVTIGEELDLLDALEAALEGRGAEHPGYSVVPRAGGGTSRVLATHSLVAAALAGQPVSLAGGATIESTPPNLRRKLQQAGTGVKVLLLAAVFLVPLLFAGVVLAGGGEEPVAALPSVTASPTETAAPSPTPEASATPSATASPSLPSATPFAVSLLAGEAAPEGSDPASLELAGLSYVLGAGRVVEGQWLPVGAEWLRGTEVRRVVALPYEAALVELLPTLKPGDELLLRLRSGEVVRYRLRAVQRRARQQIEVLAGRDPSLVVILAGEPSAERWLILADAVQTETTPWQVTGGAGASGSGPEMGEVAPEASVPLTLTLPLTDAFPSGVTTILTSTQTVTNSAAGLVLTVGECERASRIGEQEPPSKQSFLLCDVTFTALPSPQPVPFSAGALALTEASWLERAADWWPSSVPVRDALRSGTLRSGSRTHGRMAGLVAKGGSPLARSRPVLVWEQAGVRFVIQVE